MPRYWVGVVSKNHVLRGVEGNFCQVCHGKGGPLNRMKKGDYLLLGGEDFDSRLINYLVEEFKKDQGIDLRNDPRMVSASG